MMEKITLRVEGMRCGHCVLAVEGAMGALPGVKSVAVDLAGKLVTVAYEPARCALEEINSAIEDQGYEVVG